MACIRHKQCSECKMIKAMHDKQTVCRSCAIKMKEIERTAHLTFLDSLPIETRVARIEEWMYNFENKTLPSLARK